MSYIVLPEVGSELGPCPEPCEHIDCKQTRQMAQRICRYCDKPIGYQRAVQQDEEGVFYHMSCWVPAPRAVAVK